MFSIYRSEEAVVPLAEAWECADEPLRAAILRATYDIDRRLAEAPRRQGESRGGDVRILFRPPVAVFFEIDEDRNLVRILRTWLY